MTYNRRVCFLWWAVMFVGLTFVGACDQTSQTPAQTGNEPETRQLIVRLISIWESGATSEVPEIFWIDAIYDDVPNDYRFEGIDEIQSYVAHVHDWSSEVSFTVIRIHASDEMALAEWEMQGLQSAPIRGRVPIATGNRFTLRGLTLIEVENGRIRRAADYIDVATLMRQLDFRITPPDCHRSVSDSEPACPGDSFHAE